MKHLFPGILILCLLAACSPSAALPEQFQTWRLPPPGPDHDLRTPVVWLGTAGSDAVLGTGSSFSIVDKDPNGLAVSGMPAPPALIGDALAQAALDAGETAVIIISPAGGTVQSAHASLQPWTEEDPESFALFAGRQLRGELQQAGDLYTFTLEPLGTAEDSLLVFSIDYDNPKAYGDVVHIWRLNPRASTGQQDHPAIVSHGGPVVDLVSFVDALRAAGAAVEPAGTFQAAFFTGDPVLLKVNSIELQVYEYADGATAAQQAGEIAPHGEIVLPAEWAATPHFYLRGRIIVQYVGEDPGLLALLESLLGPQVAGG